MRAVTPEGGRSLSIRQKLSLALEIALAYPRAAYLMRRYDLRSAVASMRSVTPVAGAPPAGGGPRLAAAVLRVLRLVPTDSRCLVRSLVLVRLLARRGISHTLVIGARTQPRFGAHAWVEHEGTELLPGPDPAMKRLTEV